MLRELQRSEERLRLWKEKYKIKIKRSEKRRWRRSSTIFFSLPALFPQSCSTLFKETKQNEIKKKLHTIENSKQVERKYVVILLNSSSCRMSDVRKTNEEFARILNGFFSALQWNRKKNINYPLMSLCFAFMPAGRFRKKQLKISKYSF